MKTYAVSPYSVALARSTASSSVAKVVIGATGPKISWVLTSASAGTSASTVGLKKKPGPSGALPPVTTRAPAPTACSTRAVTLSTALSSMSGPTSTPSS